MELISIVDCNLCVTLPPHQTILDLPLPEAWGRLTTILGKTGWDKHYSPDLTRYASALDFEEIRVCRSCGTHYHFHQDHDPHFSEPREPETDWHLWRLTPTHARAYYIDYTGLDGAVEQVDGGWFEQRYQTIIELLRRDLLRAPDLQIKEYMVESLFRHYEVNRDWEGLRDTLIAGSDPSVRVYTANRIFGIIRSLSRDRSLSPTQFDNVSALLGTDTTRERLLVAVLAEGLSQQGQLLHYFLGKWEPVGLSGVAMRALRTYVPRENLALAIPALITALQKPGSADWWREAARDLLIEYVGVVPEKAKAVLEALVDNTDEALAVRTHCQKCLAQ